MNHTMSLETYSWYHHKLIINQLNKIASPKILYLSFFLRISCEYIQTEQILQCGKKN